MNFELILYGIIGLLIGLIGITIGSRKSLKDKKNEGWTYTRSKLVASSWGLLIVGALMIVGGLFSLD